MKKILVCVLAVTLSVGFYSCEKKEYKLEYVAVAKTEVGKLLVDETDLIANIHSDTSYTLVSGVTATEIKYLSMTGMAMKAFIFEVDLSNPKISIEVSTPFNQPNFRMQEMTRQATYEDRENHKVWAGINADFYNMATGSPQGVVHKEGVVIKSTVQDAINTFFAINSEKKAVIGDQELYSNIKSDLVEAVGGRVILVEDGNLSKQTDAALEPRTAIGVSEDGTKVYMLAVDGRNFHYSNGMNYEDLGKILKVLGSYDAINLDGGGSTTFFIRNTPEFSANRFELRNWPTDNGGKERAVANGLLIISND